MCYVLHMRFANPSHNKAEYEAVLHGMRMAKAYGATRIKIHGDSNLIAQQVMKDCDATCANMITYHAMYDKLEGNFECCEVTHIGGESNKEADSLANIGSNVYLFPPWVFFEEIFERSVKIKSAIVNLVFATRPGAELVKDSAAVEQEKQVEQTAQVMLVEALWTKSYLTYLLHGELPEDAVHHQLIMRCSKSFTIIA
jgi:hypothetical protein